MTPSNGMHIGAEADYASRIDEEQERIRLNIVSLRKQCTTPDGSLKFVNDHGDGAFSYSLVLMYACKYRGDEAKIGRMITLLVDQDIQDASKVKE